MTRTAWRTNRIDTELRRERVAELTRQGLAASVIAEILHVTARTVHRDRVAVGCAQPFVPRMTADEIARAEALFDDGCSLSEVARTLGRSSESVRKRFPGRCWTREQTNEYFAFLRRHEGRVAS